MPAIVIRNLTPALHAKLKEQAQRHHRSMAKQAVTILEEALGGSPGRAHPAPVRLAFPLTDEFLNKAKQWGRV